MQHMHVLQAQWLRSFALLRQAPDHYSAVNCPPILHCPVCGRLHQS